GGLTNGETNVVLGLAAGTTLSGLGTLPPRIFYVATNGNDATAVIGNPNFPWSSNFGTNSGVCTLATNNGDVIMLFPGNYFVSNVWLKDGVVFEGTAPRPATYLHTLTNGCFVDANGPAMYST